MHGIRLACCKEHRARRTAARRRVPPARAATSECFHDAPGGCRLQTCAIRVCLRFVEYRIAPCPCFTHGFPLGLAGARASQHEQDQAARCQRPRPSSPFLALRCRLLMASTTDANPPLATSEATDGPVVEWCRALQWGMLEGAHFLLGVVGIPLRAMIAAHCIVRSCRRRGVAFRDVRPGRVTRSNSCTWRLLTDRSTLAATDGGKLFLERCG